MGGIRPRESRWIAKPRKPRPVLSIAAAFTFLVQFPNLFGHLLNEWFQGATLVWMTLIAVVGAFGLLFAARELFARRKTARDHALMDGAFGEQYPVEITVVVQDKRIGTDRGVVWFADDLMGFSGEASSFVLASSDFTPQRAGMPGGRRKEQPPNDALLLRGVPKASYIVVTPLLGHGRSYRRRFREFASGGKGTEDERLKRFVLREEIASAERQWPPLKPYEETAARR